ncbi:MAG: lysophospholipid acyltransferase family protein [Planctomycetes bacterium]|nr:lysophospholipid acyltransferase family protein [Planctomycetota bacterium]
MAKPRNKMLDLLAYLGMRIFVMFVHMFGFRANYRTAAIIGNLMYRFDKRHRRRGLEHLRRSFPDWDETRRHAVLKASMRNLIYLGIEVMFTTRLITPGRWRRHVKLTKADEALKIVTERKTGLVVATPHFGNWEVLGYTLATIGYPMTAVARPLDNPYLNNYVLGVRERNGLDILFKKGATQTMDEIIENKGVVGFIPDQDAGRRGIFVNFFGRLASTYKSLGLLAIRHNVPIVIGSARRLDEIYHFELYIQRVIHPHEWADKPDPLRWVTQEWNTAFEQVIRTAPEQYLWLHRRWKHRPPGEEPAPDGIA